MYINMRVYKYFAILCVGFLLAAQAIYAFSVPASRLAPHQATADEKFLLDGQTASADASTTVIRQINAATNDLIYDPVSRMIYASVPSGVDTGNNNFTSLGNGNSIVAIDPATLNIGSPVFVGSEPDKLALSDNGQYLYVTLKGAFAVRRFDLASQQAGLLFWPGNRMTQGSSIPISEGPIGVKDIKVLAGQPESVAIVGDGLAVYDNGVRRPTTTPQPDVFATSKVVLSNSPSTLYALGENGGDFFKITISSNGISSVRRTPGYEMVNANYLNIQFDNGLIYTDLGQVIDPETPKIIGKLAGLSDKSFMNFVVSDSSVNRIFALTGVSLNDGLAHYRWTINAYDQQSLAMVGSVEIPGIVGDPKSFVRWGANGFAFRTSTNQLFVLRSSLVPSSESTDMPLAPAAATTAPTPVPSSIVRQISLPNNDLIYDSSRGTIYASVPAYAGSIGNSIASVDPVTGNISTSIPVGSDPSKLALSQNGQYLYTALNGTESVRRVDLAAQTAGLEFPIGHLVVPPVNTPVAYPHFVEDMEVLPDNPESVVLTRIYRSSGSTSEHAGLVLFDNGVQRGNTLFSDSDAIEFGGSAERLYSMGNKSSLGSYQKIIINPSGMTVATFAQKLIGGFNDDMKYDGGLLYSIGGRVVNAEAQRLLGTFRFPAFPSFPLVAPDSQVNRAYYLVGLPPTDSRTATTWTLRVYDTKTFLQVGTLDIPGVKGAPGPLIRWGKDGLAFGTSGDQIFFIQTSLVLDPNDPLNNPMAAATFVVRNTNDTGPGSLRQAILNANAKPGADTIIFNIASGPQTINVGSSATDFKPLPVITDQVIIDGTTQPGFLDRPIIELNGNSVANKTGEIASGLYITAGNCTVKGLVINRFLSGGIRLEGGSNTIQGNYIGTDLTGTLALGHSDNGLSVYSSNNVIGGAAPQARNIISGNNGAGINISGKSANGNRIEGNYIGTSFDAKAALGNGGNGISIKDSPDNVIGGLNSGVRNIVSGNHSDGILISGSGATGNQVRGNYVGTDASGTAPLGNDGHGMFVNSSGNLIGGTAPGARNVLSGNKGDGLNILGINGEPSSGNQVFGNHIGVGVDGGSQLGNNGSGIFVSNAFDNIIGGTATGAGNIIAFNNHGGVFIVAGTQMLPRGNAVRGNSIFYNNGLGIDLDPEGVTINDVGDGDTGANQLQNFPLLNSAFTTGGNTVIKGSLNSVANTNFAVDFYATVICGSSGYGEGRQFIGSQSTATDNNGNANLSVTLPVAIPDRYFITATATDSNNNSSEFSKCLQVPTGEGIPPLEHYVLSFVTSSYTVSEGAGSASISVARSNVDATTPPGPATVDYTTSDGTASQRKDYTLTSGTLKFAAGEFYKTFTIPITDNAYQDGNRTVNLTLSNATGNPLRVPTKAVLTITDNDASPFPPSINPIDNASMFVRQHYYDFLNRLPDDGGLNYWTSAITSCPSGDAQCVNSKRVSVSAAFFIEQEFQETGGYVYRFYKASYGQQPTYAQFMPDRSRVVGGANLDTGKQAFADAWVLRPEFLAKYPATMPPGDFVDALIGTVKTTTNGVVDLASQRATLLALLQTSGRGSVVRLVAENAAFKQAEYNKAFVLMQYFGYLRRDPDQAGYDFWLDVLNNRVQNNYRGMVCAFTTSAEYQDRFSSIRTRNDSICGQIGP